MSRTRWMLAALLLASGIACRTTESAKPLTRFEYSRPQMGVDFRIVLYAPDQARADTAAAAAFARVAELNALLSDYEETSEITRLSKSAGSAQPMPIGPDLAYVLEKAQSLATRTQGAFDVTVRPLVQVWRRARRQREMPALDRLATARELVGYQHLELDTRRQTARLKLPGMSLDLGGIAKGYAADEALRTLRAHHITRTLVAVSGDMIAGDPPPGATGWRIELPSLDSPNSPAPQHVLLSRAALSTSGDLFQRLELGGKRYSHIIDPRTGRPITDHSLVTVIARDGITADSLATAISVLGPEAGLELARRTAGVQTRIQRQPGERFETLQTGRFAKYLEP